MEKVEKKDITLMKNYTDREIIRRSMHYIKPVAWMFLLGIFIILINVGLNILLPRITGSYMDSLDAKNLANETLWDILIFCVGYLVVIILNMGFTYLETVIIQRAGQKVIYDVRQDVFNHIETFSHEQLSKIPVGRLVTRVTNDTNSLNDFYTNVIVNLFKYSLSIITILINMFFINWLMSLYICCILVGIIIITIIYRHYSQIAFKEERKQVSNLNSFLSENLSGIKLTQIFNQENRKVNEFALINRSLLRAKKQVMYVFAFYRPSITFLYYLAIGIVFFTGFPMVLNEATFLGTTFTMGLLTTFYSYTENLFGPVQNLAEIFDKLQSGIVSSGRIFNILDMKPTVENTINAKEIDEFKGKIEFKNVWFSYIKDEWILKDVSFVIYPGQTVAFVGATGAGKSTILNLIVRDYDIQKGQILIDDVDIKDIKIESIRKKVGQMLQDVFMFSGSIKDNITLNNDDLTDEEINAAIKYVNADYFINKLPNGINTEVSERGSNFSAGQRQLISFARTVVAKPQILILDEATANIDTETEVIIQDSLAKMRSIGTMIVVAHRLSTIQHADNIICLSHGEILEQGTNKELLKKKGYYYKLYQLQFEEI
ncbi:MAG: ABC transporter ATP-binding protein [Bacilli bacterium]